MIFIFYYRDCTCSHPFILYLCPPRTRAIFQSVSAFAPIVNPMNCPWGQKAFTNYLGGNKADWEVTSQMA